jgi:hypothetical protein
MLFSLKSPAHRSSIRLGHKHWSSTELFARPLLIRRRHQSQLFQTPDGFPIPEIYGDNSTGTFKTILPAGKRSHHMQGGLAAVLKIDRGPAAAGRDSFISAVGAVGLNCHILLLPVLVAACHGASPFLPQPARQVSPADFQEFVQ